MMDDMSLPRRVLVTGSRDWTDHSAIFNALQEHLGSERAGVVIHGDCPTGADAIAQQWVDLQPGIVADRHPANWEAYGRAAGPLRNRAMVAIGADVCLAFPLGESRGTRGCMKLAEGAGIPVLTYEAAR